MIGEQTKEEAASPRSHPSALRRAAVDIDTIIQYGRSLDRFAAVMRALIVDMEASGMDELDQVDGVTKFDRGSQLIAQYIANLQRSITDQKFSR